jgi:histidinol phosphatase-like enzyme
LPKRFVSSCKSQHKVRKQILKREGNYSRKILGCPHVQERKTRGYPHALERKTRNVERPSNIKIQRCEGKILASSHV